MQLHQWVGGFAQSHCVEPIISSINSTAGVFMLQEETA